MDQNDAVNIEEQLQAKVQQLQQHLAVVQMATKVLSARAFCVLALLGALGWFGWAVGDPGPSRIVAAGVYALLIFLPTLWLARDSFKGN